MKHTVDLHNMRTTCGAPLLKNSTTDDIADVDCPECWEELLGLRLRIFAGSHLPRGVIIGWARWRAVGKAFQRQQSVRRAGGYRT